MIKYIALLLLLVFPLSACWEKSPARAPVGEGAYVLQVHTQAGKTYDFTVELALTPEEQAKGLMHRTVMAENAGMLFYFGADQPRSFWMRNTLIPLDIIFVKLDGSIHHIHENAIPEDETPIPSLGNVGAVFEINGGLSKKLGIKPGDTIKHQFFNL
jgi:uncharacterized membrane protein (UPF0127 family)